MWLTAFNRPVEEWKQPVEAAVEEESADTVEGEATEEPRRRRSCGPASPRRTRRTRRRRRRRRRRSCRPGSPPKNPKLQTRQHLRLQILPKQRLPLPQMPPRKRAIRPQNNQRRGRRGDAIRAKVWLLLPGLKGQMHRPYRMSPRRESLGTVGETFCRNPTFFKTTREPLRRECSASCGIGIPACPS